MYSIDLLQLRFWFFMIMLPSFLYLFNLYLLRSHVSYLNPIFAFDRVKEQLRNNLYRIISLDYFSNHLFSQITFIELNLLIDLLRAALMLPLEVSLTYTLTYHLNFCSTPQSYSVC